MAIVEEEGACVMTWTERCKILNCYVWTNDMNRNFHFFIFIFFVYEINKLYILLWNVRIDESDNDMELFA